MALDPDVVSFLDVVYVRGYGRVRADAVALHQSDELSLGQVRRRRGCALLELHRRDRQRLALSYLTEWIVLDGPVRHYRGPPRRGHGPAADVETFAPRHQHGSLRDVRAIRGHGRDEVPRDEIEDPPRLPATHRALRRGPHGRDGRVIARILTPARLGHGSGQELLDPLAPGRVTPLRPERALQVEPRRVRGGLGARV